MKKAPLIAACVALLSWPATAEAQSQLQHYQLRRHVIELAVDAMPAAPLRCTVTDNVGATSATVTWEPADSKGLKRFALLPMGHGATDFWVSCTSNVIDVPAQQGGVIQTAGYQYRVGDIACNLGPNSQAVPVPLTQVTGAAAPSVQAPIHLRRCQELAAHDASVILQKRYDVTPTTVLRSLDPVTPLLNDALTALTAVAVERGASAATEFAQTKLSEVFCDRLIVQYLYDLSGSVGNLLATAAMVRLELSREAPLLPSVCNCSASAET